MANENGTNRNRRDASSYRGDGAGPSAWDWQSYPQDYQQEFPQDIQQDVARPGAMRPVMPGSDRSSRSSSPQSYDSANYRSTSASQFSRDSGAYVSSAVPKKKKRTVFVVVLVLILVAAIVGIGLFIYKETRKSEINEDLHKMDEVELEALDEALTGTQTFEDPFIVLLLGSDKREDDPDMGERTDTNILMRVDPVNNVVSLMSIQRDTMITIDGVGTTKFNAAYTYGGAAGTIQAVKDLTGVDVDHYAEIDFQGLEGLIDAVGGIDVYVPETIDDHDAGGHVDGGQQHLNGSQALVFARSRAYQDGDYTRASNQRLILESLAHKLLETPASELSGVIQASTEFLTTDSAMDFDFI
ncbi:MAG: LCP family protein [Eggerthellaceae bacterium]|nr:LCP family protein [Eggerthellaceae bacterium]